MKLSSLLSFCSKAQEEAGRILLLEKDTPILLGSLILNHWCMLLGVSHLSSLTRAGRGSLGLIIGPRVVGGPFRSKAKPNKQAPQKLNSWSSGST